MANEVFLLRKQSDNLQLFNFNQSNDIEVSLSWFHTWKISPYVLRKKNMIKMHFFLHGMNGIVH